MKRLSFWLKAAAVAALIAALGAGAALVALRAYFPEPKLRAMVLEAARKQLHREVRLRRVTLGLGGVSLDGLEVSEEPDFSAGTFLRVERFRLRPSWRALLRRRLVVGSVSAEGLSVRLVRDRDGRFNYESLISTAPAAASPASSSGSPGPGLSVHRAQLSNGRVEYRDEGSGAAWTVSALSLDVANFRLSGPFTFELSGRVAGRAGARRVNAAVSAAGRADLAKGRPESFRAEFKSLRVEQEELALALAGRVEDLKAPKLAFDAALSASGKSVLKASGEAKLAAPSSAADVEASLKVETPGLDTRLASALLPGSKIPALNLPPIQASLSADRHGGTVAVHSLNASWRGGSLQASGNLRGLGSKAPAVDGTASLDADVPEIRPGAYPFLKLPPKVWIPAGHLKGTLALSGDEMRIPGLTASGKIGSLRVSGSISRLRSARPVPDLTAALDLNLPSVRLSELPVPISALPPSFVLPAARVTGGVGARGEDVSLSNLTIQTSAGSVRLDGRIAKALAGAPEPALEVAGKLDLPALTSADLPFPGVPPGLELPPTRWDAELSYAPRAVRVKNLRLRAGSNDLAVSGSILDPAGRRSFDLLLKCRRFSLPELTRLTPATRDLRLEGTGFFAFAVTGTREHPIFAGKGRFQGVGAQAGDLAFADFGGTLSADPRRLDIPDLKGRIGDGNLRMDLTVKNYSRAPDVELEASLDRFDLGRYLAAKEKLKSRAAASAASGAGRAPPAASRPIRSKGRLSIGTLIHPNAVVNGIQASWDLSGITPDLRRLSGEARLQIGDGRLHAVGDMASQSKIVKVLVFPLLVVQKIGRLGGIRLFPDFNDIALRGIAGDYAFRDGIMTLRRSEMDSDAARVSARGTINLPEENLNLVVTAQVANVAPIDVSVTGPASSPRTRVNVAKFLTQPAEQLLKGLLGR